MGDVNNSVAPSFPDTSGPPSPKAVLWIIVTSVLVCMIVIVIIVIAWMRALKQPDTHGSAAMARLRPNLTEKRLNCLIPAALDLMPICKVATCKTVEWRRNVDLELGEGSMQEKVGACQPFSSRKEKGLLSDATEPPKDECLHEAARHNFLAIPEPSYTETRYLIQPNENQQAPRFDDGALGCSICVDGFTEGESTRVLPCGHDFHPACIDPWLLNIPGTCPLW